VGKLTRPRRSGGSGGAAYSGGQDTHFPESHSCHSRRSSTSECALPARDPARPTILRRHRKRVKLAPRKPFIRHHSKRESNSPPASRLSAPPP
jgi:hypothetical protein